MSRVWTKHDRLAALIAERGLQTKGFRRAMKALVSEFAKYDPEGDCEEDYGEGFDLHEFLEAVFNEWFGECRITPAAYKIRRIDGESGIWDVTVEVYEVEGTAEISRDKLGYYGDVSDGDGPHLELHIIDKYDHEIIVQSDDLMRFAFIDLYGPDVQREMMKRMRARAQAQHHAPVVVNDERSALLEQEVRSLKRLLDRADHSKIKDAIQDIIYGLGAGRAHKDIAQAVDISPAVVRATARLLAAKKVEPKSLVRDTHARWKAAHDALSELGINL